MDISLATITNAQLRSACASVDEALASAHSRDLYIIPTTRETLAAVPGWQKNAPQVTIVGSSIPGTATPTELLAQFKSHDLQRPRVAIIFSDQLVSPLHATLLVKHADQTQYISGLEAVAHVGYGYRMTAWVGRGFEAASVPGETGDALRLLLRYFSACEELGDQWLMRESQVMRTPVDRVYQARRQLRLFHSAVMYAYLNSPLDAEVLAIIRRIDDMQKYLAASIRT